jgi:hypothetical protein
MNKIQLMLLVTNQVMEIKSGGRMQLTRVAPAARQQFKKMVGLKKNASHLEVLIALGQVYRDNNIEAEFFDLINKPMRLVEGKPLVTPEMLLPKATAEQMA